METFTNKFHNNHTYIKINDIRKVKLDDLEDLVEERPLQIGVYSDQLDLIDFIKRAGFILKRKCYEVEATRKDLKNPLVTPRLETKLTSKGELTFKKAIDLLFKYYKKTHEDVSPLTVGLEEFEKNLPEKAFYYEKEGQILMAAFLENEEIAYIVGFEENLADEFINDLLIYLFKNHQEIYFESDNTDPLATRLRDKFIKKSDLSFDTYIKYKQSNFI